MSRYGKTKSEMLRLISQRKDTLSEISSELGLAPSTVSKHLNELQELGVIKLVESEYARKWKHYKINSGFEGEFPETIAAKINYSRGTKSKYTFASLLIIAVIAGLLAFLVSYQNSPNQIPIAITDPPYLPAGTSAVYLNYSSIQLNYSYGGVNSTVFINASGTLNAMNLINVTKVIALANVKPGSKLKSISINISSGSIVINNSTYALTLPVKRFTTYLIGNSTVNSSTSILIDLSSVVVPYFTNNSTVPEGFAFMPKLSGALTARSEYVNMTYNDGHMDMRNLWNKTFSFGNFSRKISALFKQNPSINISNVSMFGTVNGTEFHFSIANSANYSIQINGVAILSCNFDSMPSSMKDMPQDHNATGDFEYNISNGTVTINVSKFNTDWSGTDTIKTKESSGIRRIILVWSGNKPDGFSNIFPIPMLGLYYEIAKNGTLSSSKTSIQNAWDNDGYTIAPNGFKSFNYIAASNSEQGNILSNIVNATPYRVVIFTSNGIKAYMSNSSYKRCGIG